MAARYPGGGAFTPTQLLKPGARYTAVATTGIMTDDLAALPRDYAWSFTTLSVRNLAGDLKKLPNGASASLTGKVLYHAGSRVYVEEPDRSSGIWVQGELPSADGILVDVTGVMNAFDGECYLNVTSVTRGSPMSVGPLGASNRTIKNSMMDGLLIKAWGVARYLDDNSYMIADGSDSEGVLVRTDSPREFQDGDYVSVTGAAAFESPRRVIYAK